MQILQVNVWTRQGLGIGIVLRIVCCRGLGGNLYDVMIPWKQMADCIIHLLFLTNTTLSRQPRHRTEQGQIPREHSCRVSKS